MGSLHHEIDMSSRRACLESFARSFGEYPPRHPVPDWWDAFDAWYRKHKDETALGARTEAFGYDDDDEDDS